MQVTSLRPKTTSRNFARLMVLLACALVSTTLPATERQTAADAMPGPPLEALANELAPGYGQQQMDRLAKNIDRDSLIAATLIGSANGPKATDAKGHADVLARLVRDYPADTLAMYTAALVCHVQSQPCVHPDYQAELLRLAPDNAIHFLLIPNAGEIDGTVLHAAATANFADTHFSALLGIVRSALENQPAPSFATSQQAPATDPDELALILRRNEVLYVPWPTYAALIEFCNPALAARHDGSEARDDCAMLGLKLFSELGDNIVTRLIGSSLVRRFAKGTAAASDALALRRQYVWVNERDDGEATSAEQEQLQDDEVRFGEWQAFKKKAARAGVPLIPPEGWAPANPKALLLPEDQAASLSGD